MMRIQGLDHALILLPGIAFIEPIERRFQVRFGDRIAFLHSGLWVTGHRDQWMLTLM